MERKISLKPFLVPESRPPIRFVDIISSAVPRKLSVKTLENEIAGYTNNKHAIAFSTARYALAKLLEAYGCKGKKVVISAYTCIAAVDSIRWAGAEPLFLDINLEDYSMKLDSKSRKILDKEKNIGAIIITHLYGIIGDVKSWTDYARERKIPVIEDAAIALGAKYKGKPAGSLCDSAIVSLQSAKIISGVRGGIVLTSDDAIAKKLQVSVNSLPCQSCIKKAKYISHSLLHKTLSSPLIYGITLNPIKSILLRKDIIGEAVSGNSPKKVPDDMKYKLSGVQARLALSGLRRIEKIVSNRRKNAKAFQEIADQNKNIVMPFDNNNSKSVYGRFPIIVKGMNKEQLHKFFFDRGIQVGMNYPYICPSTPNIIDMNLRCVLSSFPNSKKAAESTVLLPIYDGICVKQIKKIVGVLDLIEKN